MTAHTPGPWHHNNDPSPQHIYSPDNTLIAMIAIGCDRDNARLIAAAPELLEALEALRTANGARDFNGWHPAFDSAIAKARAALSKAKGLAV